MNAVEKSTDGEKSAGIGADATQIDDLIARARGGDVAAMGLVLERFQPLVASSVSKLARRLEGSLLDGQDLAQEATKMTIELIQEYTPQAAGNFGAYLKGKLHWRLVSYVRRERNKKRRQAPLDDDLGDRLVAQMRSQSSLTVANPRLRAAMRILSPRQRSILFKLYWEGRTVDEVAGEMNVSGKNVRALRQRAEEQIRESFAK